MQEIILEFIDKVAEHLSERLKRLPQARATTAAISSELTKIDLNTVNKFAEQLRNNSSDHARFLEIMADTLNILKREKKRIKLGIAAVNVAPHHEALQRVAMLLWQGDQIVKDNFSYILPKIAPLTPKQLNEHLQKIERQTPTEPLMKKWLHLMVVSQTALYTSKNKEEFITKSLCAEKKLLDLEKEIETQSKLDDEMRNLENDLELLNMNRFAF